MQDNNTTKRYYPFAIYIFVFALLAIIPAGITAYLSIKDANRIQAQADQETMRRSHAELIKELSHLADELIHITTNLATWDETRSLFVDSTYYNYWRDTRIKGTAQYKGLIDAVDLYTSTGKALTPDFQLSEVIIPHASTAPSVIKIQDRVYLIYYHPVSATQNEQPTILGYVGARMNLNLAAQQFLATQHSFIAGIDWQVPDSAVLSIEQAIQRANIEVTSLPEISAFSQTIRQGFTQYLIYALSLVTLLVILLFYSIARPMGRLTRQLQGLYSGTANTITDSIHGVIRISELEGVRQAINDFKMRFHTATATLEEKNAELMRLTYHDPLTGCFNRRAFEARLEHAIETAIVEGKQHALCYIDLDQFKVVNDSCGHIAGDELLKQIAVVLERLTRDADMVARLGGDEFGILLEGCDLEQAHKRAEEMRLKVKTHGFAWQDKPFDISISIGLVQINADSTNPGDIWKNADAACYVAKDSGRNLVQIYQQNNRELAQRYGEIQWISRLKQALDQDRFELHAQLIKPITGKGQDLHYEVLLRMRDDKNDLVPPMAFIPAAERYNLMAEIDRWVIKRALQALKHIQARIPNNFMLSINLSGQSLGNKDTLEIIKTAIAENGIQPKQLCFEITETAAITNLTTAIHFIRSLRAIGCQFSLDDFGSGLSSFGYLSNLEVDYIKIDGEFIKSLEANTLSYSIVSAINQIGHVMGVRTIAEFVENDTLLNYVSRIGIDFVQGYGIHKPEPLMQLFSQNAAVNS